MDNVIYYENFMSNKNILHSNTANTINDGLVFLIENNADIITYNKTDKFLLKTIQNFQDYLMANQLLYLLVQLF